MLRIYLLIFLAAFFSYGCGTSSSGNSNEAAAVSNTESNQQAVELDKNVPKFEDAQTALKRGIEYLDANYVDQAIDAFRQASELDKDLAEAHFQLGVALSLKESAEEKTVSDEVSPESTPAKSAKEKKTESEIAFENAVKAYKKLIAKDKENASAYYNLGRSYIKLFDDENARKALEQSVKLNEEDTLYRTELGAVLIKLAQYPSAIKQLEKALELDDSNYRAEDLLVKARAGKKRVDHGQKESAKTLSSNSSPSAQSSDSSGRSATRPRKVEGEEKAVPPKKDDNKGPPTQNPKNKTADE